MGRVIAITNQKGGVGKTTTCVNLAASMAATGRAVLLVDLDPQGNATMASGIDKNDVEKTTYDVLVDEVPIRDVMIESKTAGYAVVPSNSDVTAADVQLIQVFARELRLRKALAAIRDSFDYVFIDCPPSLSLLTVNALCAADSVIVPMQCEYFALEGIASLTETIRELRAPSTRISRSRESSARCATTAASLPRWSLTSSGSTSARRSTRPSSRETSSLPRLRATVSL